MNKLIFWSGVLVFVIIFFFLLFALAANPLVNTGDSGSSVPIYPEWENAEHRALVDRVVALFTTARRDQQGRPMPKQLEFFLPGDVIGRGVTMQRMINNELSWRKDDQTDKETSPIDIRVLKTLEYLAERHEYIRIKPLRVGTPQLSVDIAPGATPVVAYTHFFTGQGLFIEAVDFREEDKTEGRYVPIELGWQRYIHGPGDVQTDNDPLRHLYNELQVQISVLLKDYLPSLRIISKSQLALERRARSYLKYREEGQEKSVLADLLERSTRLETRLDQATGMGLDEEAYQYFSLALNDVRAIKALIKTPLIDLDLLSEGAKLEMIKEALRKAGSPEAESLFRSIAQNVFRGAQVANISRWQSSPKETERKAYEARQKVRQVAIELLAMPRETNLGREFGYSVKTKTIDGKTVQDQFDKNMVAKQIVAYAPEDDLDNALFEDIYPRGVIGVTKAGRIIDAEAKDGAITFEDEHFSHLPSQQGIFSSNKVIFIFSESLLDVAAGLVFLDFYLSSRFWTGSGGLQFGAPPKLEGKVKEEMEAKMQLGFFQGLTGDYETVEFSYKNGIQVGF